MRLRYLTLIVGLLLLAVAEAVAGTPPRPTATPTPAPATAEVLHVRSLAEYAERVRLEPLAEVVQDGVIGNETVTDLAEGVGVTQVHRPAADLEPAPTPKRVDPRIRTRWRRQYARQHEKVARLISKREALESELKGLRRQVWTTKTLARLDAVKAELHHLESEIAAAEARLNGIVTEARKEGALPSWFRGL